MQPMHVATAITPHHAIGYWLAAWAQTKVRSFKERYIHRCLALALSSVTLKRSLKGWCGTIV